MRGIGDTIEVIAKKTGIKKMVAYILDECGCEQRKEKLNKLIPYGKSKKRTSSGS